MKRNSLPQEKKVMALTPTVISHLPRPNPNATPTTTPTPTL